MQLTDEEIPYGWESTFEKNRESINKILAITSSRGTFYPQRGLMFRAFWECPLDRVRVVIFGQDPYKQADQACGLSFSVPSGTRPPPSLQNIFKCIKKCYPEYTIPNHGDLSAWCKQGVLLLNVCLAYFPQNPMNVTQRKYCMPFITNVIRDIHSRNPGVIFVMWGKEASSIELPSGARKLVGVHPSGMNGSRFVNEVTHFREINAMIYPQIDWSL